MHALLPPLSPVARALCRAGVAPAMLALLFLSLPRAEAAPPPGARETANPSPSTLAVVDVTVVPMDRERLLEHQTVVIRDGVIAEIGDRDAVRVPEGATVVRGEGKFLMPGLADMHIHLVGGAGDPGDAAWQQMSLLLANGITTARSLSGSPTGLALRERIRRGEVLAPRLYLAGPSLNHRSVPTPDAARRAVREQAAAGYDFIKTHGVGSETYDAMAEAAREAGIRLVGHVTGDYGLERALAAGQQIEHLDGYLAALLPEDAPVPAPPGQVFFGPELEHMQESRIPGLVRATLDAGVWNSPTLALFEVVAAGAPPETYAARPEMRLVPAAAREAWARQVAEVAAIPASAEARRRFVELRRALTRALAEAGAPLMAGSDSPQLFLAPGFALHEEIEALVGAGLSPFQALAAATRNPGQYLAGEVVSGVVTEGAAADLLLLDGNPLASVRAARSPAGLILRGRWISRAELEALTERVASAAASDQP